MTNVKGMIVVINFNVFNCIKVFDNIRFCQNLFKKECHLLCLKEIHYIYSNSIIVCVRAYVYEFGSTSSMMLEFQIADWTNLLIGFLVIVVDCRLYDCRRANLL